MSFYDDLVAERYSENRWWTRKRPEPKPEDELTCRRRLTECVRQAEAMGQPVEEESA